ncbi:hypothetical protein K435DRAFT_854931 [Dendrothele bispora CBS 962.96]|uniref:Uncharacterized protein n=1 Tax=Dendrothele bispora (strain CBS 962.96) TaxID=1314807 RepID=A0A4S8MCD9_DENBC|nr:hypothetical protein K435DRAFT_854931 [Dendrothele bispora CBS 962.96]
MYGYTNVKQEPKEEEQPVSVTQRRHATGLLGSGGYFDSQTTDTQYYGFSQSSSDLEEKEERLSELDELENDSDSPKPELQDYDGIVFQSQLPEEFVIPEDEDGSLYVSDPAFNRHTSQTSINSAEWVPNADSQKKIDDLLSINYGQSNFLYDLIEQQDNPSHMRNRWQFLREDCPEPDPSRLALLRLTDAAQVSNSQQRLCDRNPVHQGYIVVASLLIRIAYALTRHVGSANSIWSLKDTLDDGRALLKLADELVSVEGDARNYILEHELDLD